MSGGNASGAPVKGRTVRTDPTRKGNIDLRRLLFSAPI